VSAQPEPQPARRRPHPRAWLTTLVGGRRLLERLTRLEREQKRARKERNRTRKKLRVTRKRLRATRARLRRMRQRELAAKQARADMLLQIDALKKRVHALEGKGRDHDKRLNEQRNLLLEQVMAYELHLVDATAVRRDLDALGDTGTRA
jgi:chromosome segregation ATPase